MEPGNQNMLTFFGAMKYISSSFRPITLGILVIASRVSKPLDRQLRVENHCGTSSPSQGKFQGTTDIVLLIKTHLTKRIGTGTIVRIKSMLCIE